MAGVDEFQHFEKIEKTPEQIQALYDLLGQRKYGISHRALPSFADHEAFVRNHPYRCWYLIKSSSGRYVGSFYLMNDNCVGLSVFEDADYYLRATLAYIERTYSPLPAIPSVRAGFFFMNIAPGNKDMQAALLAANARHIQSSYELPISKNEQS